VQSPQNRRFETGHPRYVTEVPRHLEQPRASAAREAFLAVRPPEASKAPCPAGREFPEGTREYRRALAGEIQRAARIRVYQNWDNPFEPNIFAALPPQPTLTFLEDPSVQE
jgi:hypothetical protein